MCLMGVGCWTGLGGTRGSRGDRQPPPPPSGTRVGEGGSRGVGCMKRAPPSPIFHPPPSSAFVSCPPARSALPVRDAAPSPPRRVDAARQTLVSPAGEGEGAPSSLWAPLSVPSAVTHRRGSGPRRPPLLPCLGSSPLPATFPPKSQVILPLCAIRPCRPRLPLYPHSPPQPPPQSGCVHAFPQRRCYCLPCPSRLGCCRLSLPPAAVPRCRHGFPPTTGFKPHHLSPSGQYHHYSHHHHHGHGHPSPNNVPPP